MIKLQTKHSMWCSDDADDVTSRPFLRFSKFWI